ncbi:MAG: hypothetical protein RLY93_06630 [Sumerlaeia bacterium]
MKLLPYLLSTALVGTMLVGCGQQEQEASSATSASEPAAAPDTHTHSDGSTHATHDETAASQEQAHSHGGEIVSLGEKQVLGFTVKAEQEGAVTAGQEAVFLIETTPAAEAVRLWVGDEQATGSVRSKAEGGPTSFHSHAMVPSPLTAEAQLWVEVQNAAGERGSVAFDLGGAAASASHSHGDAEHSHEGEAAHSHDEVPAPANDDHGHSHDDGDHGHSH